MKVFLVLALALSLILPEKVEAAPLYEVYGKNGIVTFTTRKPRNGQKYKRIRAGKTRYSKVYRSRPRRAWNFSARQSQFDRLIVTESKAQGVPAALTKAVIHVESAFKPRARSPKGASGLMQLMPPTAKRFGVGSIFDPQQNIRGGVKYLRWLIKHFGGRLDHVLAGYNAGEGAVKKYSGVPPYKETVEYVKRVRKAYNGYRKQGFGK